MRKLSQDLEALSLTDLNVFVCYMCPVVSCSDALSLRDAIDVPIEKDTVQMDKM